MFYVDKARDANGVNLRGDFFDLDRLYYAILKFTGFYGIESKCTFEGCSDVCEALLGLCYEIRHAWQGNRDLYETYNGIRDYWFDDYPEYIKQNNIPLLDIDENDDDEYKEFDDDEYDDDIEDTLGPFFSRKDYPDTRESNTYFSIPLIFPEVLFYAMVLSDLLKQKDIFLLSKKVLMETEDIMQELNKQYYYFEAEEDIARLTMFVKQTFHELYRFIGEEEYFSFINKFEKISNYALNCDQKEIMVAMEEYRSKEFDQDDPKILISYLSRYI